MVKMIINFINFNFEWINSNTRVGVDFTTIVIAKFVVIIIVVNFIKIAATIKD